MTLIRFTDAQLHELMQAARMVPPDLRDVFLERVAVELQGKPLGDGLVHRVAYQVARTIRVGRRADGGDGLGALTATLWRVRRGRSLAVLLPLLKGTLLV